MAYDAFDVLSTEGLLNYSSTQEVTYNQLEKFFPTSTSTDERLNVQDLDVNYSPTALAVAENTVAPLAQRPSFESKVIDFTEFKLEHRLTDKQIRILRNPRDIYELEDYENKVFNDVDRLINGQYIACERMRAGLLLTGKTEINENGFNPDPVDWGRPMDQIQNIDFEKDDVLEKLFQYQQVISQREGKNLSRMIISKDIEFKMRNNPNIKTALSDYSSKNPRRLKISELQDVLSEQVGFTYEILTDENGDAYGYTPNLDGKKIPFIPNDKCILLPAGDKLGDTVYNITTEQLELGAKQGVDTQSAGNIFLFSNYTIRPVNFIITSVSRFVVTFPAAKASYVLTQQTS